MDSGDKVLFAVFVVFAFVLGCIAGCESTEPEDEKRSAETCIENQLDERNTWPPPATYREIVRFCRGGS